jgi:chromosome segregation ATPase
MRRRGEQFSDWQANLCIRAKELKSMDPQVETALAEERRKRAEAEAALAEEKRKVAALEAEQRKAAEALQALREQQHETNKQPDAAGMTAPATDSSLPLS